MTVEWFAVMCEQGTVKSKDQVQNANLGARRDNLLPSSLIANVPRELSLCMNFFESSRFLWRSAFRRASFRKPAATSTAFVSVKRDSRGRKMIVHLSA